MINIQAILQDSVMQSLILSPLMGVIFAALFSGFTPKPMDGQVTTVIRTKKVYRERIIEKRQSGNDDGLGFFMFLGLIMCFVLWKYAAYYDQVLFGAAVTTLTVMAFACTTIMVSFIKGQYTSIDWWAYTTFPVFVLAVCMFLIGLAKDSFNPELQDIALSTNLYEFYFKKLSDYGRNFMLTHVLGLIVMVVVLLITTWAQLHYLSLMNLRSGGVLQSFWLWLANLTSACSGRGWLILCIILLGLSYIGLSPDLSASWLTR